MFLSTITNDAYQLCAVNPQVINVSEDWLSDELKRDKIENGFVDKSICISNRSFHLNWKFHFLAESSLSG